MNMPHPYRIAGFGRLARVAVCKAKLIGLAALWLCGGELRAQSCEDVFRQVCRQAIQYDEVGNRILHTTYRSVTHFKMDKKASLQTSMIELELYVGKEMVYYQGDEVVCMQDAKQCVRVLPQSKKVLVGKSTAPLMKGDVSRQWRGILQDSLLASSTITVCEKEMYGGQAQHRLVFSILPSRQALFQARQMTIWVDVASKIMRRVEIIYPVGFATEKTEIFFSEPQWLESAPKVPVSARSLVWDKKGQLLPAYRQYEIVYLNK